MNERQFRVLTGAVALTFFLAAVVLGARIADGLYRPTYTVEASFAAAGQGLSDNSDVKIHGVNIGRVRGVSLHQGRALVRMEIDSHQRIPVDANATIRPKTLFGEKFVDIEPGPAEQDGPFLDDGDTIERTLGGFELEQVLSDIYPILQAVDPQEIALVLATLARGGEGLGPAINRQIANFEAVARVQAEHADNTRQFLRDLALLSEEFALRAGDVVAGAADLNVALPTLNARADDLALFLEQGARLGRDVADVLEANKSTMEKAVTEGGKVIGLLFEERAQIGPLVIGLRQFFQVLAEASRIPFGDTGTNLAAIKLVLGEDCVMGRLPLCVGPGLLEDLLELRGPAQAEPRTGVPPVALPPPPTKGVEAIVGLVQGLLR